MRIFPSLLLFAIALVISGGAWAETIDVGRGEIPVRVPAGYDAKKPAPLVMLVHGYTGSGEGQERYMKFGELADEYGFLMIAPNGTVEKEGGKNRFWNAGNVCCNFQGSTVDDSAYLLEVIDTVKEQFSVNDRRVYLIGHSNGAYMSHRMAMEHPDTIAAIAGLAGMPSFKLDGPEPERPVHILQIHGTNDRVIRFEGGKIGNNAYPSARETIDLWAKYNGVPGRARISPKKLDLDKSIEGDETTVTKYRGGRTELWTIQDGTHIPTISDTFSRQVIEWLMAHPKSKR